jgi:transposase InsO family protein
VVTVEDRRRAVQVVVNWKVSERRACQLVGLARSTFRYQARPRPYEDWLREKLRAMAQAEPSYGYRFQWALLVAEGHKINVKRIERLWKQEGLTLPRRKKRYKAVGPKGEVKLRPHYKNQVWSYDFAFDGIVDGKPLKILAIIDEYTRELLALQAARSIRSSHVVKALEGLIKTRGTPEFVRSDNGPEFIANRVRLWMAQERIDTIFINPGSPWENPFVESFISTFRLDCLDREWFLSVRDANFVLRRWKDKYNHRRPHSSLGYRTPAQAANI